MGWSQATQAAIEAGTRKVYASDLPKICDVLGVDLGRLLIDAPKSDIRKLGL